MAGVKCNIQDRRSLGHTISLVSCCQPIVDYEQVFQANGHHFLVDEAFVWGYL